jgi:Tol biopolymer transport system component
MGVSTDRGIWVAPSQDENPRRLPKTNDVQNLVWAPDGKFIYFVARSNTQELQLWEISPANGQKRQLTALEGRYGMLAVSALATDGLYLYFSWREDTGDLWVMDVEGE